MLFNGDMQALSLLLLAVSGGNFMANPGFEDGDPATKKPTGYELSGHATYAYVGYADELASMGVIFDSFSADASAAGKASQMVLLPRGAGRWVTFRCRGRAEDGFRLKDEQLGVRFDFYSARGTKYQDSAKRLIYREILKDRRDFAANGNTLKNGAAVWRTYEFEEYLPFEETDSVKVSVEFSGGNGASKGYSRLFLDDFELTLSDRSKLGKVEPHATTTPTPPVDERVLTPLGGRWFYRVAAGETLKYPLKVWARNAERLYYKDSALTAPFAGNMSSWLQPGHLDENGEVVAKARFLEDNFVIMFRGDGTMLFRTKDIPNHPTARFPDTYGTQGYNPNSIAVQDRTYTLPVAPAKLDQPKGLPSAGQNNGALPMGPIGVAVNGVYFFNPYDMDSEDASRLMDRCCGHPAQPGDYHYHKYPICVNTAFVDKGERHSPLIGFALDGFPVYGPYESAGTMAKEEKRNPLDRLNAHYDADRGWHYHVTPGKFPYIIGGYLGRAARLGPPR